MTTLLCLMLLSGPSEAELILADARKHYAAMTSYRATIESTQSVAGMRMRYRHTLVWTKDEGFELRFVQAPGFLGQPDYISDGKSLKAIWSDRSVTEHGLFNPRLRVQPWEEYGGPILGWLVRDAEMESGLQPGSKERARYTVEKGELERVAALIVTIEYVAIDAAPDAKSDKVLRLYFNPNNKRELWVVERDWQQIENRITYYPAGTPVGTIRSDGLQFYRRADQG